MGQLALPIDEHLPALRERLERERVLLLTAEPGAGKTTRLPAALLAGRRGQVWVLEPRRLAARMAARRVAAELGERVGETVGYRVRFEDETSSRTRLVYLTEGVLTRRLAAGDDLSGVSCVVLDEFHERHLDTDLALVLLDRLRRTRRPDLGLVIMSATLDARPLEAWLGVEAVEVPGRLFPVEIEHERVRDTRRLPERVQGAVGRLLDEGLAGHVLVFLPGTGEIRACEQALAGAERAAGLRVFPLHGRLDPGGIEQALRPSQARKVILSTNVAESSLTIEGVEAVIDAGSARVSGVSARTGLPYLRLEPIARSSAIQRANRAGRQGPGRCLRLYSELDFQGRPAGATPELLREDLAGALLTLHGAGVRQLDELRWLDPPPESSLEQARTLLTRLGALSEEGELSEVGECLRELPLPPRVGRFLLEGGERGVGSWACDGAALLSERDLRAHSVRYDQAETIGACDVLARIDLLEEARRLRFDRRRLGSLGVDANAARAVDRASRQLRRALPKDQREGKGDEEAFRIALLAGHPDRVGRRGEGSKVALSDGGGGRLSEGSVVREHEWLLALDAIDPRGRGREPQVTIASAIEPEWLLDLFPEALEEHDAVRWDPQRERVEVQWELRYGGHVLESSPGEGDPGAVAAVLREAAAAAGPDAFCAADEREALLKRLAFLKEVRDDLPLLDEDALAEVIAELCEGRRSFKELRDARPLDCLIARLGEGARLLRQLAPETVELPGRRRCPVNYERRQAPWIQSRLQDFFGLSDGPRVGGGQVPLVLHLLAPNKVAVSVTTDLAGFWERTYPREMKALRRRYPRHKWPEDPAKAEPPRRGRAR